MPCSKVFEYWIGTEQKEEKHSENPDRFGNIGFFQPDEANDSNGQDTGEVSYTTLLSRESCEMEILFTNWVPSQM